MANLVKTLIAYYYGLQIKSIGDKWIRKTIEFYSKFHSPTFFERLTVRLKMENSEINNMCMSGYTITSMDEINVFF